MQWTSKRISFRGTFMNTEKLSLTSWTLSVSSREVNKAFRKISNIRLWTDLCPRKNLERYKDHNVYRKAFVDFSIHFSKRCGRANFSVQLWSSSHRFIFYWSTGRSDIAKQHKWHLYSLILRQQPWSNWTASRKNSPNVVINGSKWKELTWIEMIVGTKIVPSLSSYRCKRIS